MVDSPFGNVDIILVRPQHSGNIGSVARSIANHGLGRLHLVNPPAFDPLRARWMAPNAHDVIDNAGFFLTVEHAVAKHQFVIGATARQRKWSWPSWTINDFCKKINANKRCAILFGPEDSGLTNEDLKHCHGIITLPTWKHQSLNLAQAVNVIGGHLMAHVEEQPPLEPRQNPDLEMKLQTEITNITMGLLEDSGYLKSRNPLQVYNQLLRLLQRSNPSVDEVVHLKGMMNKLYHHNRILNEKFAYNTAKKACS